MRRRSLAVLVLGALASAHRAPPPLADRVTIHADFEAERVLAELHSAVERSLPTFERYVGRELPQGERIVLHLFATRKAYEAALEAAQVEDVSADSDSLIAPESGETYAVLDPDFLNAFSEEVGGLPEGRLLDVLRLVVPQYLVRAGVAPLHRLPDWYAHGLPGFLASESMPESMPAGTGADHPPLLGAGLDARVALDLRDGRSLPLTELFSADFKELEPSAGRAAVRQSRSVVAFLADSKSGAGHAAFEAFQAKLDAGTLPDGDDAAYARGLWGESLRDARAFEKDWRRRAETLAGGWHTHWGAAQWSGDELALSSLRRDDQAAALAGGEPLSEHYDLACEVRIADVGDSQADVLLSHTGPDEQALKVSVTARGRITLMGYRDGVWYSLRFIDGPELEPDAWHRVRVEVRGRTVTVRVGEDAVLGATIPRAYRTGGRYFGLGCYASVVRFRGWTLSEAKAPKKKRSKKARKPAVMTWLESGPPEECVDILFVGDGYTKKHKGRAGKYWKDVKRYSKRLFEEIPFKWYESRFNVRALGLESEDAGCDLSYGEDAVDSVLDCTFNKPDDRLIVFRDAGRLKELVEDAGGADIVLVMVNTEKYGGAGTRLLGLTRKDEWGPAPTFSAQDTTSFLIAVHELGHSFAGLADTYVSKGDQARFPLPEDDEEDVDRANVSREGLFDPSSFATLQRTVKWKHFLELPGAEEYEWFHEGGYYRTSGIFRPWKNCRMRAHSYAFCPVCCEEVAKAIFRTCGLEWDDAAYHREYPLSSREWPSTR